ncbi:MAG: ABC transporter ATP-binding protein [Elusimicrobia bacterium]|nr:ABC transporter ATP-binding protein [Elusimicrobiota bacterium]
MEDFAVETINLSKSYIQGHEQILVLEEIGFKLKKGEFAAVVGPSGSGKSTLLNLLGILDSCYSGEIKLFGRNLSSMDEAVKAKIRMEKIGFVFQFDSLLPEFTVLENIDMPANLAGKPDENFSRNLLKKFNLEYIADKFPMDVSGGEKQRAAVLRALRNGPGIVLADEPTGNLDKHNAGIILADFKKISSLGTAVIMVTHNEEAAMCASKIYHLSGGKLTAVVSGE